MSNHEPEQSWVEPKDEAEGERGGEAEEVERGTVDTGGG